MLRVWCLVGVLLTFCFPAKAATTIYADSVYSQSGPVIGPALALGQADSLSAVVNRTGILTLQFLKGVAGGNVTVTGVKVGAGTTVQVFLGAIVAGVPTFTLNQNFPGVGGTATFNFTTGCAATVQGCTLMRIRVVGGPTASFALDGVSGVQATPEPSVWALMILAFVGVAARLKSARPRQFALTSA